MPANLCIEVVDNTTFFVNEIEAAGATDLVTLWNTNNAMPAGPTPSATTGEFEIMGTTFTATGTAGQYSADSAIPTYVEPQRTYVQAIGDHSLPCSYEDASYGLANIALRTPITPAEFYDRVKVVIRDANNNIIPLNKQPYDPSFPQVIFDNPQYYGMTIAFFENEFGEEVGSNELAYSCNGRTWEEASSMQGITLESISY